MKDYYDQKSKTPYFQIGQRVWVYTPKTKKFLHNWFGSYLIVEQSSPVHFRLQTENNKQVSFAVHAKRMKPFFDPASRPVDPSLFDDPSKSYLEESEILEDCFDNSDSSVDNTEVQLNQSNSPDAVVTLPEPQFEQISVDTVHFQC